MSNYLEKVIYLSQEDYSTLLGGGTVTKNGRTLSGINPSYIYITNGTEISDINNLGATLQQLQDRIIIKTTAEWQATSTYIPPKGTILIYSDKGTSDGINYDVPGIKVADGLSYGIDQAFVGDDILKQLTDHISSTAPHVSAAERTKWNNKLNCEDTVSGEVLVLNRN